MIIRLYRYFRDHQAVCWLSMVALFVFLGYFATRIHLEEDIDKINMLYYIYLLLESEPNSHF